LRIEQLHLLPIILATPLLRRYEEMPRGPKVVRKRKQKEDDLSFLPPYSEQAKYLARANTFLSNDGADRTPRKNLICIDEGRIDGTETAAFEHLTFPQTFAGKLSWRDSDTHDSAP
jgi:hypothetical protein